MSTYTVINNTHPPHPPKKRISICSEAVGAPCRCAENWQSFSAALRTHPPPDIQVGKRRSDDRCLAKANGKAVYNYKGALINQAPDSYLHTLALRLNRKPRHQIKHAWRRGLLYTPAAVATYIMSRYAPSSTRNKDSCFCCISLCNLYFSV